MGSGKEACQSDCEHVVIEGRNQFPTRLSEDPCECTRRMLPSEISDDSSGAIVAQATIFSAHGGRNVVSRPLNS
jgi:hypothetical protein